MKYSEWDITKLRLYLSYDFWKASDGLAVLAGLRYPYQGRTMLDYEEPNFRDDPSLGEICAHDYDNLSQLWERSKLSDSEERYGGGCNIYDREYPPAYFIEWALSKCFRPEWLDWAVERGLYTPKQEEVSTAQPKANQPANPDWQPAKWRKAFEYESEGLNALYDLIESHYFDAGDKPIYDPAQLPLKKSLKSEWLTGRTRDEADTIITSGQRKGKAEK